MTLKYRDMMVWDIQRQAAFVLCGEQHTQPKKLLTQKKPNKHDKQLFSSFVETNYLIYKSMRES